MTDNEIIKALKLCQQYDTKCSNCPLWHSGQNCVNILNKAALDLINRQKAEIKRLKRSVEMWSEDAKYHFNARQTTKAEAIKEFAERLKPMLGFGRYTSYEDIDILVKETVGDTE